MVCQCDSAGEKPRGVKEWNFACEAMASCASEGRRRWPGMFWFRVHEPGGVNVIALSVSGAMQLHDGLEMKCVRKEVRQSNSAKGVARRQKSTQVARKRGRIAGDVDD